MRLARLELLRSCPTACVAHRRGLEHGAKALCISRLTTPSDIVSGAAPGRLPVPNPVPEQLDRPSRQGKRKRGAPHLTPAVCRRTLTGEGDVSKISPEDRERILAEVRRNIECADAAAHIAHE